MTRRQLTFHKGAERWIWRYGLGDEHDVVDDIHEQAANPLCRLDWLDAAILTLRVLENDLCT